MGGAAVWLGALALAALALAALLYWLLVITEGVFLGRRLVVWLYDRAAPRYDARKGYVAADEQAHLLEPLLGVMQSAAPRVLDVATGSGRVPLLLLGDARFDGRIDALDASAGMLAQAAARLAQLPAATRARCTLHHAPALPLPFPDASFDLVTCLEALEFMPDDGAALAEMARVLRPGGALVITRRRGWEAWTFLHRYRAPAAVCRQLAARGIHRCTLHAWQSNYDLVEGWRAG